MRIRNPSKATIARRELNLNSTESLEEVEEKARVVIPLEPQLEVISLSAVNSTGGTIIDTPSGKDFYLKAASLSMASDNFATSTETNISAQVNNVATQILAIKRITLTANNQNIAISFPGKGVKVDRNTPITISNTTATAAISAKAIIFYYTEEVVNDNKN